MVAVGVGWGRLGNATIRNRKELGLPHLVLVFSGSDCVDVLYPDRRKIKTKKNWHFPSLGRNSPPLAATPAMMSSVSIGRSKEGKIDETWGRRRGQRES